MLDPSIPVLGAQALDGGGVLHSFVVAMRLAVDRIQVLLSTNALEDLPQDATSANALYSSIREIEALPDSVEASISSAVRAMGGGQEEAAPASSHEEDMAMVPPIPYACNISAGHLWPTLKARSILAAINGVNQIVRRRTVASWAPAGSIELQTPNGWILHTHDAWIAADESSGRMDLLRLVRRCLAMPEWIPDGRAFCLASHEGVWRIWMISPELPTVYDTFTRALRGDHLPDLVEALRLMQQLFTQMQSTNGVSWNSKFGDVRSLALQNGRAVWLSVPDLTAGVDPAEWRAPALSAMTAGVQNCVDTVRLDDAGAIRLRETIRRVQDGVPDGVAAILRQKLGATVRMGLS